GHASARGSDRAGRADPRLRASRKAPCRHRPQDVAGRGGGEPARRDPADAPEQRTRTPLRRSYGKGVSRMNIGARAQSVLDKIDVDELVKVALDLAIKDSGVRLKGDLLLMAVVGEIGVEPVDEFQSPAYLAKEPGTRFAITHGGVADYALVAEGTDFGIVGVEAGKAFFKVTVFGND